MEERDKYKQRKRMRRKREKRGKQPLRKFSSKEEKRIKGREKL